MLLDNGRRLPCRDTVWWLHSCRVIAASMLLYNLLKPIWALTNFNIMGAGGGGGSGDGGKLERNECVHERVND